MATRIDKPGQLEVGEYYEACNFHPCLCMTIDEAKVHVEGISLVNGVIYSCNVRHCGLRKLTVKEAIKWKTDGPQEIDREIDDKWWT